MMMMIHELALITCSMCVCTREFCLACSRMLASVPLSKCDDIHAYTYPDRYVYVYPGGPILCIHSLNRVLISYFSSLFLLPAPLPLLYLHYIRSLCIDDIPSASYIHINIIYGLCACVICPSETGVRTCRHLMQTYK